ncbi:MAG: mechanosensitive ion channel [Chloroflexi bacterium]|nr:mechanosensitive ion channel [Chloroflexota bacterium]
MIPHHTPPRYLMQMILRAAGIELTAIPWGRIGVSILLVIVTITIRRLVAGAVRHGLVRTRTDPGIVILLERGSQIVITFLGLSWVLDVFGMQVSSVVTLLGVSGVAVGLAIQDVLKQLVAGIYLIVGRPFVVGDLIQIPMASGTVLRVDLLFTVLGKTSGEIVIVPNALFIGNPVINQGSANRSRFRARITVPLGGETAERSQLPKVREQIEALVRSCRAVEAAHPITIEAEAVTAETITLMVSAHSVSLSDARDQLAWAVARKIPGFSLALVDG